MSDTPDFRALAQELVETWDATADFDFNDFGHAAADIVDRARAALAAPTPEPLSPAARAVFETFNSKFEWIEDGVPGPQFHAIAAALRALADQVVPPGGGNFIAVRIRAAILAIATELRGQ